MNRLRHLAVLLTATLSLAAYAQSEAVVVKRATDLRQMPSLESARLLTLPAETPLTRLPVRQGAWVQVRTSTGETGWVHMFDVGSAGAGAAPSNSATSALRGLGNFFSRGAQPARTTTATSTVGIRGLGAEDIAQAQPNLVALAQMDNYRQDALQARRFAADAALRARVVEPLPVPAAPQATTTNNNSNSNSNFSSPN